jgi:hypothetical protein
MEAVDDLKNSDFPIALEKTSLHVTEKLNPIPAVLDALSGLRAPLDVRSCATHDEESISAGFT